MSMLVVVEHGSYLSVGPSRFNRGSREQIPSSAQAPCIAEGVGGSACTKVAAGGGWEAVLVEVGTVGGRGSRWRDGCPASQTGGAKYSCLTCLTSFGVVGGGTLLL